MEDAPSATPARDELLLGMGREGPQRASRAPQLNVRPRNAWGQKVRRFMSGYVNTCAAAARTGVRGRAQAEAEGVRRVQAAAEGRRGEDVAPGRGTRRRQLC